MTMRRNGALQRLAIGAFCAALVAPACAQPAFEEDDNTRAVRILEGSPQAAPEPSVQAAPPMSGGELPTVQLKADNPAGLSIEILPGPELRAGAAVAFRVTSRKRGYLLLVDVDANGKLTQIYPNRNSLLGERARESSNLIKPGQTVTVPDRKNPWAGFEFVASPPEGVAMVVAILSDLPVQMIDLPDVPVQFTGRAAALQYLTELARDLRVPNAAASGALQEAKWSFDAKFYLIR
jgi:hypothetical protein